MACWPVVSVPEDEVAARPVGVHDAEDLGPRLVLRHGPTTFGHDLQVEALDLLVAEVVLARMVPEYLQHPVLAMPGSPLLRLCPSTLSIASRGGSRDPISPDPGPRGSPGSCPAERSSSSKGLPKPRITPLPQSSSARSDRSSTRRGRVARASPRFGSLLPDRLRGQERQEGPVEVLRPVEHGVVARPLDDEESAVWDLRPHQISDGGRD